MLRPQRWVFRQALLVVALQRLQAQGEALLLRQVQEVVRWQLRARLALPCLRRQAAELVVAKSAV